MTTSTTDPDATTPATVQAAATPPAAPAGPAHLAARAAVVATAAVFGLTYSLSAALIAIDLAGMGFSETVIGANASMHAVGVLITAFLLPRAAALLGMRRAVLTGLALSAAVLLLFPLMPDFRLWFPLRILLGAASETLFVLSETWLNALSSEATRARAMAVYTSVLSLGFALGPVILSLVGTDGAAPYITGASLTAFAAVFIISPKIRAPAVEKPAYTNPVRFMKLSPPAMAVTALNAAVETAGLTFLALYAVNLGWDEPQATRLMSCLMAGAIVLQLPIGWLGDKTDRRRLLILLAAAASLGALVWPSALKNPLATYGLLFVWGGLFVGIYTIMLAVVGSRFSGSELIGLYAAMGLMWGAGALLGPLLAGGAMQLTLHGLPLFVAAACGAFCLMVARTGKRL
ncbi:MAG: MFS transporter [Desulfovibrio sp.]|nr:MFS transporter [Desulfovibrio sp.]